MEYCIYVHGIYYKALGGEGGRILPSSMPRNGNSRDTVIRAKLIIVIIPIIILITILTAILLLLIINSNDNNCNI